MRGRNVMYTLDRRVLALAFMGVAAGCSAGGEDSNPDSGLSKDVYVADRNTGMPTGPTGVTGPSDGNSGMDVGNNSMSDGSTATCPSGPMMDGSADANGMDAHDVPDANNNMDANSGMPDASNGVPDANNIPDAHNVPDGGPVVTNNPPTLDPAVPNMYEVPIGRPIIFMPKGEDPDVGDSLEYRADVINMSGDIVYSTQWSNSREVPIMLNGMAPQDLILALYVKDMAGNETQRDVPVKAVNIPTGQGARPIGIGCNYNERNEIGECVVRKDFSERFCRDYGSNGTGSYHPEEGNSIEEVKVYPNASDTIIFFGGRPGQTNICFRLYSDNGMGSVNIDGLLEVKDKQGNIGYDKFRFLVGN